MPREPLPGQDPARRRKKINQYRNEADRNRRPQPGGFGPKPNGLRQPKPQRPFMPGGPGRSTPQRPPEPGFPIPGIPSYPIDDSIGLPGGPGFESPWSPDNPNGYRLGPPAPGTPGSRGPGENTYWPLDPKPYPGGPPGLPGTPPGRTPPYPTDPYPTPGVPGTPGTAPPQGYGANVGGAGGFQPGKLGSEGFKVQGFNGLFKALSSQPFWQNLNANQQKAMWQWFKNHGAGGGFESAIDQLTSASMAPETLYNISNQFGLDPGKLLADIGPQMNTGALPPSYINNAGNTPPTLQPYQQDPAYVEALMNYLGPQNTNWSYLEQMFPGQDMGGPPGNMYDNLDSSSILNQMGGGGPQGFQFGPGAGSNYGGSSSSLMNMIPGSSPSPMSSLATDGRMPNSGIGATRRIPSRALGRMNMARNMRRRTRR